MKKRLVQYGEQAGTNDETTPMPGVPAPMVERAFRVLDILSVSEAGSTVAKTVNYPKQDRAIHTIVGTQPWAVTIAEKPNHTNQDSNRFFPTESGEHEDSSAATATPSQWPYRSLA